MKRGQASVEYVVIVGFVTIIIIGILSVSIIYSSNSQRNVKLTHISNFGNKLIASSEKMFYSGYPSKTTVTTYLPEDVTEINITENMIIVSVKTKDGLTTLGFPSHVNITGSISPSKGVKRIEVVAYEEGYINITQA